MKKFLLFIFAVQLLTACGGGKEAPEGQMPAVKQYTIEQFYNTRSVRGGAFSPDETRLLVSSNESGIFNLVEIEIATGKQTALTQSKTSSLFAVDYVPSGGILYSADKDGNEISHLYLLKADGTSQDLTPAEKEKAGFAGWNHERTAFYYTSNKRDERFFDLYKMEVDGWKSSLVYENKEGFDLDGLSADGTLLGLSQGITTSENLLFVVNLKNKSILEISEKEKPGNYSGAGFSLDNKTFYYIANAEGEFASLMSYDIASGERKKVFDAKWDVMFSNFSENEKYRTIGINEDGKTTLRIQEVATGNDISLPAIPDGDILASEISRTEKNMRLTVGSSKSPADIYVYNFETRELKKLTQNLNPEIAAADLVEGQVVRFKSFDGLVIPAIFYKPHQATASSKVPAVLFMHGGPGGQSRLGYSALIQYLVNHGYAVLAVNNRGSSGYGKSFFKMDDQNHGDKDLKDCIWGKKYLQTLDYIDREKIGIMGGSYGGYLTMAAMTFAPEEFKVGVDIFGVTNWLRTLRSIPPYWESFRKALYQEMGDPNTADSVRLYNISPLFHAGKVKNPVMVLQGASDPRVLQVESDEIVAAIKANNVPVEYVLFPDEGHGFVKKENEIKGYGAVLVFLDKYLKGGTEEKKENK